MNVIDALCSHGDIVIPVLLGTIAVTSGIALWLIKKYISDREELEQEFFRKVDLSLRAHDECQKMLPEKYSTRSDLALICTKLDKIADVINQFHLVYRTKDEAQREWRLLETRLTSMESAIAALANSNSERHREIWDKLNRVVDFFKEEREKLETKLNGVMR